MQTQNDALKIAFQDFDKLRAYAVFSLFASHFPQKVEGYYIDEEGEMTLMQQNNLSTKHKENIFEEKFDIMMRHGREQLDFESKLSIVYGGFGIKEGRLIQNKLEEILVLPIASNDEVEKVLKPEAITAIYHYFKDKTPCKYLIPGGNELLENELQKKFFEWGSQEAKEAMQLSNLQLSIKIFVLWNNATFEMRDNLGNIMGNSSNTDRTKFLKDKLLVNLQPYFVLDKKKNAPYYEFVLFKTEATLFSEIKRKPPHAILIAAETEEGVGGRLSALQGLSIAGNVRSIGEYKGSIFVCTIQEKEKWQQLQAENLYGLFDFLQTPFTYTYFLPENLYNAENPLAEGEKEEIAIRQSEKITFMKEELRRRICNLTLDLAGKVRSILHDIGHSTYIEENMENVLPIFQKINALIPLHLWEDTKVEILQLAAENIGKPLRPLLENYRNIWINLADARPKTTTEIEKHGFAVLIVDDDRAFAARIALLLHEIAIESVITQSVQEAKELLKMDTEGKLFEGKANYLGALVTDWHFYVPNCKRWALQQGQDLIDFVHEQGLAIECFILTGHKGEMQENTPLNQSRIRWFYKEENLSPLIYQIKTSSNMLYPNLLASYGSWTNKSARFVYPLYYYYFLHRTSKDYLAEEIRINDFAKEIYDKFLTLFNKDETLRIGDFGYDKIMIEYVNNHGSQNPIKNISTMRNKLLARRIILALATYLSFEEICHILFDMDYLEEERRRNGGVEVRTKLAADFSTYLCLPSDIDEMRKNMRSKINLLPEEIMFLNEYVMEMYDDK